MVVVISYYLCILYIYLDIRHVTSLIRTISSMSWLPSSPCQPCPELATLLSVWLCLIMSFLSMIQQAGGGAGGKIPVVCIIQRGVSVISCDQVVVVVLCCAGITQTTAWEPQYNMFAVFSWENNVEILPGAILLVISNYQGATPATAHSPPPVCQSGE